MEDFSPNKAVGTLHKRTLSRHSSYRPLEEREMRYLALYPYRESVGLLECSLHYAKIGSVGYGALSYTWGDPAVTETILLDNEPFLVTTNLAALLKALNKGRAKWNWPLDNPLNLWVDALCINQDDIPERNEQVLHMDDIYKTAGCVLIWLGPQAEHTELAFNRLAEIEKEVSQVSKGAVTSVLTKFAEIARRLIDENIPEHLDINVERATREGLRDIVGRAWWKRTWILQEIVANNNPIFFCGEFTIFKNALSKYIQLYSISALDSGSDAITRIAGREYTSMAMALTMQRKPNSNASTLLQLLQDSRASEATDPRDKIYGILGLCWDFSSDSELVPDYNLSVREVYTSVVKAYIEKYNNLDIFGHCGYTGDGLDLPSWVPDWRSAPETITGVPFEKTIESVQGRVQSVYHASGEILSFGDYIPMITNEELCLHGFHLDVVETLYQSPDYTDSSRKDVERSWMPKDKSTIYLSTGESMEEAYLRTIVADFHTLPSEGTELRRRGFAMVWPETVSNASETQSEKVGFALNELMRTCHKRRFAYTKRGWMGIVPVGTQIGDSVAVLLGGQMLYVLHSNGAGKDRFRLVGEAYLHGMMDGEAMEMVNSGERAIEKIVLE